MNARVRNGSSTKQINRANHGSTYTTRKVLLLAIQKVVPLVVPFLVLAARFPLLPALLALFALAPLALALAYIYIYIPIGLIFPWRLP